MARIQIEKGLHEDKIMCSGCASEYLFPKMMAISEELWITDSQEWKEFLQNVDENSLCEQIIPLIVSNG